MQKKNCRPTIFKTMNNNSGYITANSRNIYYEFHNLQFRSPNKPILVFLHEGLGSCAQWKDFPKQISDQSECTMLMYDRYGYGKSEMLNELRDNDYMDIEGFDSLPDLLEKLNINEKVILIGHSDGGTIALLFASKYREKVLGVITEADHIFCEEITYQGFRATLKHFESGVLKRVLYKYHQEKTETMFHGWCDTWLSEGGKIWNVEKHLKNITSPVLSIQGKDDAYGSVEQLISKLKNVSGTIEILFIENCGHEPHFQAKELVQRKMMEFISKIQF